MADDKTRQEAHNDAEELFVLATGCRCPQFAGMRDGAVLDIGPGGLTAYVFMANPSPSEIAMIKSGSLDATAGRVDDVLVMTMRFGGKRGVEYDVYYTPGFTGMPEIPEIAEEDEGMGYMLTVAVFDRRGTCRALRVTYLSTEMSRYVHETVSLIAGEPFDVRAYHDTCDKVMRHYSLYELRRRAACRFSVPRREAPADGKGDADVR